MGSTCLLLLALAPTGTPRLFAEELDQEKETELFNQWKTTIKHPAVRVREVKTPPVIDGKMDEAYLKLATPITTVLLNGSKNKPAFSTTAYVLSDKEYLYVYTRCMTPFPDGVLAKIQKRDQNIFHDETVEMFLDPTNFREDMYFHILVNAIGTTGDIRNRNDPSWNPALKVKTGRDPKKAWLMEIRIPFADLGVKQGKVNKIWSFNLNRTARPEPKPPLGIDDVEIEDTAWSPTYSSSSHRPQMFGYLWLDAGNIVNTVQRDMVKATADFQRPKQAMKVEALPLDEKVDASVIVDEYAVKRPESFGFAQKPIVTRKDDTITIAFETTTFGDVTIAIEDMDGNIVRHLASGVLGKNAPAPFKKDSLKQEIIWDAKDDHQKYIDALDRIRVRVSLGLKPQFERTLFWSPQKRWGTGVPMIRATAEGVYVFDNSQTPQLRLFDHAGNYERTVYPFPANKAHRLVGVQAKVFPHDGKKWPVKYSQPQSTLLTTADLRYGKFWPTGGASSLFANAMEIVPGHPSNVYIVNLRLNRLATDGTTGGLNLHGPQTCYQGGTFSAPQVGPWSAAASPDGKWLYMTGFMVANDALHGVVRMDPKAQKDPELFAGKLRRREFGKENNRFKMPASVDCDSKGRVYVADYLNDRIQVFQPSGTYVATIPTKRPSLVRINRKTNEIFVFSWPIPNWFGDRFQRTREGSLTHFDALSDSFQSPRKKAGYTFPWAYRKRGLNADIDFWTDPPTVWMAPEIRGGNWAPLQIKLLTMQKDSLQLKRDFANDVQKVVRYKSPGELRQRLYVNQKTGKLYVGEYTRPSRVHCKWFKELLRIDPEMGGIKKVRLPMDAEDMAFDLEGHGYLRAPSGDFIVRFDPKDWREVPFDYGETRGTFISGLVVPGISDGGAMSGGFSVAPNGQIAVHCAWKVSAEEKDKTPTTLDSKKAHDPFKKYAPPIFPGRWVGHEIHIFDKHGRWSIKDAVPGIERTDGLHIDNENHLYMTINQTRFTKGQRYFNDISCTFLKVKAGQNRILSAAAARVKLPESEQPARPAELTGHALGAAWVEGAQWFRGALGLNGRNVDSSSEQRNCDCVAKSRSDLDLFKRSFISEVDHYSVVVLDANGNPVTRIGRMGNVDDGRPLTPEGGPTQTRSIGGDEVAIFHAMNVATHTDRRLFIADVGNQRILSVKLGYHASQVVDLKDVPNSGGK